MNECEGPLICGHCDEQCGTHCDTTPVTIYNPDAVEQHGYAKFNHGPHLCIDVPDGNSTISVRTSTGEKLTISFLPYVEDGVPMCVDISHHGKEKNSHGTPVNNVHCMMQGGGKEYRSKELPVDQKPTIVCIMLDTGTEYHKSQKGE